MEDLDVDAERTDVSHHHATGWPHRIARGVFQYRRVLVILWPVVAVILAVNVPALMANLTSMQDEPPRSTRSAVSLAVTKLHFGDIVNVKCETIRLKCIDICTSAATAISRGIILELMDMLKEFDYQHPGVIIYMNSYYDFASMPDEMNPYLAKNRQSLLLQWRWRVPMSVKPAAIDLVDRLMDKMIEINEFQALGSDTPLHASATGAFILRQAMKRTLAKELPVHELTTLPIPLSILASRLGSFKMILFPVISMGICLCIGFGLTYFVSLHMDVCDQAPTMMLMLCVALTLDYSLFTLTRYREELEAGASLQAAIETTIVQVGKVIWLSGIVLTIAYGSMLALPGSFKTFSAGACLMIVTCILIQLTFVPAILALFPALGPPLKSDPSMRADRRSVQEAMPLKDAEDLPTPMDDATPTWELKEDPVEGALRKAQPHMSGCWFQLGGFLTRRPFNIIIPLVVYIAMLPLTIRCMQMKLGHAYELEVPRGRHEWTVAMELQRDFAPEIGTFFPMSIIASAQPHVVAFADAVTPAVLAAASSHDFTLDVRNPEFFKANCAMANTIISGTRGHSFELSPVDIQSASFQGLEGDGEVRCMTYTVSHLARSPLLQRLSAISGGLQELWDTTVSNDSNAMLSVIFFQKDPFSAEAFSLARNIRATLDEQNAKAETSAELPGLTYLMISAASVVMDIIEITSWRLPLAFLFCTTICFIVIAFSFRAALIPIVLFFTVLLPITWAYGAALYVYEDGVLNWLGMPGLMTTGTPAAGLAWVAPMFTLTIMLGLALDYAVFLFERIFEFREEGFGDLESIQLGVSATGPIITAAGAIFAFSFIGMLLGSLPTMNHMGFLLVFSIFNDTLIVRSILVPCVVSISPGLSYWPRVMPKAVHTWL
eukprot:TRINITY_DN122824_c0_g1_i1.p1 TRINITY_DN122824_c0_g1~~TRINITY_DN122824_c0_g1_i1.p1  ORF type:complete len:890 (+),score=146.37 TRINITY_DN122824_c0_g1_i1:119-2788(+)